MSKFWWQNLSFIENFGDKICLHGSHEWTKSNTSFSLMQAECSMNLDEVKIHPLWICCWFLTCLTQFWHCGFIFDMCKWIYAVVYCVLFVVREKIYDDRNGQSRLRLWWAGVGLFLSFMLAFGVSLFIFVIHFCRSWKNLWWQEWSK